MKSNLNPNDHYPILARKGKCRCEFCKPKINKAPQMNKWLPTPENINALPEYLRDYIHQLEATCDPAGLVRENMQLKDTNDGLQLMFRKAVDSCTDERSCTPCFSGQGHCETITPQPPTAEPLISKEWLAEKLAACHDDAIGASQPKRPCDTPPGCNAGNCLRCGEVKPTAEGQTNKINPSTALCVVCGLGRHTAAHRGLLTDENKGTALDHPFTICTGRQGLIDALYAAWHREPAGETLGAIGNAIQYMQSDADLAAHALEEVMQLGYTVKNGMLFPPEQGRAAEGAVFKGPAEWTPEEVANGNMGIRWVREDGVYGRPTAHDVMDYLVQRGDSAFCGCDKCKSFFTQPPSASPVAVPGWRLVPVEPTHAMAKAAADAWLDCGSKLILNKSLAAVAAGIAAAPAIHADHVPDAGKMIHEGGEG